MPKLVMRDSNISTVMSTELNSLASGSVIVSGVIDNTGGEYTFDDVELFTGSAACTPGAIKFAELFLIQSLDGTNFVDIDDGTNEPSVTMQVGRFEFRATASSPNRHIVRGITIPPDKFKYVLANESGCAFASSGNLLRRRPWVFNTV